MSHVVDAGCAGEGVCGELKQGSLNSGEALRLAREKIRLDRVRDDRRQNKPNSGSVLLLDNLTHAVKPRNIRLFCSCEE
jgi:uncharacterized protein YeeX (DUF496 family)